MENSIWSSSALDEPLLGVDVASFSDRGDRDQGKLYVVPRSNFGSFITTNVDEAERAIKGFSGCYMKSFKATVADLAKKWLSDELKSQPEDGRGYPIQTKQRYWAVSVGRQTGITTSQEEYHEWTDGWSGYNAKGFSSRSDAEAFLARHRETALARALTTTPRVPPSVNGNQNSSDSASPRTAPTVASDPMSIGIFNITDRTIPNASAPLAENHIHDIETSIIEPPIRNGSKSSDPEAREEDQPDESEEGDQEGSESSPASCWEKCGHYARRFVTSSKAFGSVVFSALILFEAFKTCLDLTHFPSHRPDMIYECVDIFTDSINKASETPWNTTVDWFVQGPGRNAVIRSFDDCPVSRANNFTSLASLIIIRESLGVADSSWHDESAVIESLGDICTGQYKWNHIGCDDENNIISLELSGLELTGTLPSEIGALKHLKMIDLSQNYGIGGTIPSELWTLPNLESLMLFNKTKNLVNPALDLKSSINLQSLRKSFVNDDTLSPNHSQTNAKPQSVIKEVHTENMKGIFGNNDDMRKLVEIRACNSLSNNKNQCVSMRLSTGEACHYCRRNTTVTCTTPTIAAWISIFFRDAHCTTQ